MFVVIGSAPAGTAMTLDALKKRVRQLFTEILHHRRGELRDFAFIIF
jgi:hypothetical protein